MKIRTFFAAFLIPAAIPAAISADDDDGPNKRKLCIDSGGRYVLGICRCADKTETYKKDIGCAEDEKKAATKERKDSCDNYKEEKVAWNPITKKCKCADKIKLWDGSGCVTDADLEEKAEARAADRFAQSGDTEPETDEEKEFVRTIEELTRAFHAKIIELNGKK